MSEQDELDQLERQLDAAFAATRPRRDFEDELWARLHPRRRWLPAAPAWLLPLAGAVAGVSIVLVAGVTLLTLARIGGGHAGGTASAPIGTSQGAAGSAADGSRAAPLAPQAAAALPYGQLPTPPAAGVAQIAVDGRMTPVAAGATIRTVIGSPPQPGPMISVFRYDASAGPPSGAIVEPSALPPGLTSRPYPSRPATDAVGAAIERASASGAPSAGLVTLTQVRLVYVAVVAGGQGYLEPAYLFTGRYENGGAAATAQVLVPALAANALR
ncbi:MAG TPA: hypothetical protein VIC57_19700 [Candidatus Dormibacteraeota bacterium]